MRVELAADGGRLTARIPDRHGRAADYLVTPCHAGKHLWAAEVAREGGTVYTASLDGMGVWHCTCPDAKYGAPREGRLCKHAEAALQIAAVMGVEMAKEQAAKRRQTEETTEADRVRQQLSAPFRADEIKWKPQAAKGERALAVTYIDARLVQDRLDAVLGLGGWKDSYVDHPDGTVTCRLECLIDGAWVAREDLGAPSEQPDAGDRRKAAYSDALKRAAVKFGVGRYLYRVPNAWVPYDPQARKLKQTPRLPDFASPGYAGELPGIPDEPTPPEEPAPPPAPAPRPSPQANGRHTPQPPQEPNQGGRPVPVDVAKYIAGQDALLSASGTIEPGELIAYMERHCGPMADWNEPKRDRLRKEFATFQAALAAREQGGAE